jgi:putative thioredoxin
MTDSQHVLDVTPANFEREVFERSRTTPVLVDFWATWCEPCKTLTPVLEKLAAEFDGAFLLAKIDIDQNQEIAQVFGVQSVPTVVLMIDGKPVDGFMGAQPEAGIRGLLEKHLEYASDPLADALELDKQGDRAGAIAALGALADAHAKDGEVRAQLARLHALAGDVAEAKKHFQLLSAEDLETEVGRAAAAAVEMLSHTGDLDALRAAVESAPEDVAARLELGRALLAAHETEDGLEHLYLAAERDLHFNDDEPRLALIEAFGVLGEDHALTLEYRRRLSVLLCA